MQLLPSTIIATYYGFRISASVSMNTCIKIMYNPVMYVDLVVTLHEARAQNGVSGSYMYMDAIFEFIVHEESEIWTTYDIILPRKDYHRLGNHYPLLDTPQMCLLILCDSRVYSYIHNV